MATGNATYLHVLSLHRLVKPNLHVGSCTLFNSTAKFDTDNNLCIIYRPKAFRTVFIRLILFFVLGSLAVGIVSVALLLLLDVADELRV